MSATTLLERPLDVADGDVVRPTTTDSRIEASIAAFLASRPAFTDELRDCVSAALTPR